MPPRISSPISVRALLDHAAKRQLMPTTIRTAALQRELAADIRRMAVFSSEVSNAESLKLLDAVVRRISNPAISGGKPGSYMDVERGVEILQAYLRDIEYKPAPGTEGSLLDFSSSPRLRVALRTPVEMFRGLGQYLQSYDPEVLDAFPAQELVRVKNFSAEARGTARDWPSRWLEAGGQFYAGGRMAALKDDEVWFELSEFGNPYPPFDYNSGMGVRDLSRKEAVDMGLMAPDAPAPKPEPLPHVSDSGFDLSRFSELLVREVGKKFGGKASVENGVLQWL